MALDPVTAALDIGGKLIDRIWPDPAIAATAKLELIKLQQSGELAQITGQLDINKVEAASPSIWTSGWRPSVGWVCSAGLLTQFIVAPLATWAAALLGHPIVFPTLDMGTLMTLLAGMLGLSGMRTTEKLKGAEGNR